MRTWFESLEERERILVLTAVVFVVFAAFWFGIWTPLIVIVDNTLRRRDLYNALQRSQPTPGGNGIRVEFESAAFDDLMLWLGDVNRQYGLQVQSGNFSVASSENPGRVNSTLTLER